MSNEEQTDEDDFDLIREQSNEIVDAVTEFINEGGFEPAAICASLSWLLANAAFHVGGVSLEQTLQGLTLSFEDVVEEHKLKAHQ